VKVSIERSGNLLRIRPAFKAVLGPELTYERRIQSGGNTSDVTYIPTQLYRAVDDCLIVPAGLRQRVTAILSKLGQEITYTDFNPARLAPPVFENLDKLWPGQEEVIVALAVNDCGVIRRPTGTGKSFIIRQIAKMWPDARMVICTPSKDLVMQTHTELIEMFPEDQVGLVCGGSRQVDRRITCATVKSLMKVDPTKIDIFIFDEVHRAAAPDTVPLIANIQNARMYGFSASPTGRSDRADLEIEAMFGPVICTMEYQTAQDLGNVVPVEVKLLATADLPALTQTTTVSMKRWGLWRNDGRHERIQEGLKWLEETYGTDLQILVLVETVEHAVHLGHVLGPEFKLVYAQMNADDRDNWERRRLLPKGEHPISSRQREEMRVAFHGGSLRRVIATTIWGTGVDFPQLNVLVRADGQSGTIPNTQLPGRVTRKADGKTLGIVMDLDDAFHPTLEGRARRRLAAYRSKGWKITYIRPPAAYLAT